MAKRQPVPEFNLAAETRSILEAKPNSSGRDVLEALREKFPKQPINQASAAVAFSKAREKLGLRSAPIGGRSVGRQGKVGGAAALNITILKNAKSLLEACNGDQNLASAAIQHVKSLQLS